MDASTNPDVRRLLDRIDALLRFLHEHSVACWDQTFERPIKEFREWGNHRAAIKLLEQVPLGGMGGLLDRDFGKDQACLYDLCESFTEALRTLQQRT